MSMDREMEGPRDTNGVRGVEGHKDSEMEGLRDTDEGTEGWRDVEVEGRSDGGTRGWKDAGTKGCREGKGGTQRWRDEGLRVERHRDGEMLKASSPARHRSHLPAQPETSDQLRRTSATRASGDQGKMQSLVDSPVASMGEFSTQTRAW